MKDNSDDTTESASTTRRTLLKASTAAVGTLGALGLASTSAGARYNGVHEIPGRIQAEDFDTGERGESYGDATAVNSGGAYRDTAVDIETLDDGHNVGWIEDGEFLTYTVTATEGTYDITLRVAAPRSSGGTIRLALDDTELATATVTPTGGWDAYETVILGDVSIPGVEEGRLRVDLDTDEFRVGNFDWMDFALREEDDDDDGGDDDDDDQDDGDDGDTAMSTLTPRTVNGERYASQFEGETLAEKIENALATTSDGDGRVRVTPRDDGEPWTWGSDLTLDPYDYAGIHIDIDDSVEINYPGSGWALTLDTGGDYSKSDPGLATVEGGQWYSTGDPEGCFRLIDTGKATIDPNYVLFEGGSNAPVTGIQVLNDARWSEMNNLMPSGGSITSDICIDFIGSSYNSDSSGGTDSFQGTHIGPASLDTDVAAIKCRGNLQYSLFVNPQMFLFGDGATGLYLDGDVRMWGLTVIGGKTEEHASNTSSFHFGSDFDGFNNTPSLVGGFYEHPSTMVTADAGATNPHIFNPVALKSGYEIRAYTPEGRERARFSISDGGVGLNLDELEVRTLVDAESGNEYTVDELAGN